MNRILDRLYLGALSDFTDAAAADLAPCTMALTLCEDPPPRILGGVHYPLPDEIFLPYAAWDTAVLLLTDWLMGGETVLVHCRLGVSRAPALVAAYLALCGHSATPGHALTWLQTIRPIVRVHPETWRGVTAWERTRRQSRVPPPLPWRRWTPQATDDATSTRDHADE